MICKISIWKTTDRKSRSFAFYPLLALVVCSLNAGLANAERTLTASKPDAILVELYTSEGCSSCPPADAFLTRLTTHRDLWTRIVPVAFQVDYWDHLGWTDPLARPAYSDRQRRLVRNGKARAVYTPSFFVDGQEWRGFFSNRDLPLHRTSLDNTNFRISLEGPEVTLAYHVNSPRPGLKANIVLLGSGIKNDVGAGENRGRTLEHSFVALEHFERELQAEGQNETAREYLASHRFRPSLPHHIDVGRWAIAAWISVPDGAIVAVGGDWLTADEVVQIKRGR